MYISVVLYIFAIQAVCDGAPGHKYPVRPLLDGVSLDDVEKRAECTEAEKDKSDGCTIWQKQGFCDEPLYKKFMTDNCYVTCGNCVPKPTPPPAVDKSACLEAHNRKRQLHGAEPLVWDDTLEEHAQQWADHLVTIGKSVHSEGTGEGENLASGKGGSYRTCEDAMTGWYDKEEPKYDYNNPGFSSETGHFTQIVWKATKRVGVALATKRDENGYIETYIVARFSPQGNIIGQFAENVQEVTKKK